MASLIRKGKEIYYNYSTYFESSNYLYGVTPLMKKIVLEKLEKQKEYLSKTFLSVNGNRTFCNLFDMTLSANITPDRYYGELWSRVNALQKYATQLGFTVPVFMTITPRSQTKPTTQIELGKRKGVYKLINNKNFEGEFDYVRNSLNYISQKWKFFLKDQRIIKDIKKIYGERMIFMRTYEPHVDGTPHCHIVAFIPPEFLERFITVAKGYFNESRFDIKTEFDGEKGGVVAYILKYILKSFKNAKEGKLDTVAVWYSYYSIRRFSTSRNLIPLSIFRKINKHDFMQDLLKTTMMYKKGSIEIQKGFSPFSCLYSDLTTLKNKDYFVSKISVLVPEFDDFVFQLLYEKNLNIDFYVFDKPNLSKIKFRTCKPKLGCPIPVQIVGDSRSFVQQNGELKEVFKSLNNYSHMNLLHYFKTLDIDSCSLHHYGVVKNECIRRKLIKGFHESINIFNTEIEFSNFQNPFFEQINRALKYLFFYNLKYTTSKDTYNFIYKSMYNKSS